MPTLKDVVKEKQKAAGRFAKFRKVIKAITATVDTTDSCECATRPGYYWVKEYGQDAGYVQAFNSGVQDVVGMPVLVGIEPQAPFRRMIISIDWGSTSFIFDDDDDPPGTYDLPAHADSHEWSDADPGSDVVNVYQRAIVPLKAQHASGLSISIWPSIYFYNGDLRKFLGQTLTLVSYVPSTLGNHKRVLLYLYPATDSVLVQDQDEVDDGVQAIYDDPPSGCIPVAWVYLIYGDTTLDDTDITDARAFLSNSLSINDVISGQEFLRQLLTVEHHLDVEFSKHLVDFH